MLAADWLAEDEVPEDQQAEQALYCLMCIARVLGKILVQEFVNHEAAVC